MSRVFVDANIPMYAAGKAHPLVEPARRVIAAVAAGKIDAVTDAEVFQEILYRYLKVHQREKGFEIFDAFHRIMLGQILPIDDLDVSRAREYAEQYPTLGARDLVHLAAMTRHGIEEIITADAHFDAAAEVRRIDPLTFEPGSRRDPKK